MLSRRVVSNFLNSIAKYSSEISSNGSVELTNEEIWKRRSNLRMPKIQRDETISPKLYYSPEWVLEKEPEDEYKEITPLNKYGMTPQKWEFYNKTVWPPGYIVPETGLPKSKEVFHCREQIHFSPKRMWQACQFIETMNVDEAIAQLELKNIKGCLILSEVLKEAKKRATDEFHIEFPSDMHVAEAFAIQSKIIYGVRRHAHEKIAKIRYRYIDLYVRLEEGKGPDFKSRLKPKDGYEKAQEYIEYLRSRSIKYSI
ncbi:39S ribosomal protein L22, mitochondrial [Strongyloides ratti]|uniref:Large ribosomal subunit protein uL22m n=1 Tax=Strongyloides ratti TaxID=34506 RepID=A0A090L1F2_STRRB|nr:39S ribosomal protein L22, mitochondrial [Strongyloides ratti]CEF63616.1 39S ribosomal protein L22, mitochondrial [Strongyloides ratti]